MVKVNDNNITLQLGLFVTQFGLVIIMFFQVMTFLWLRPVSHFHELKVQSLESVVSVELLVESKS